MMSVYGWVIIATICGPFLLSFDKKVHFYSNWKALFPALLSIGSIFLIWDSYFTKNGIWGFTPDYISGIYIGNLPLEEVLFFLVVPYACVFIYEVLIAYFPTFNNKKLTSIFAFFFTFSGFTFGITHIENWYTATACIISALLTLGFYFIYHVSWYSQFVNAFLVALVPFIIVNGILTGAVTDQPIVWYSELHIMGPRIITIPLEDLYYNYSMLLPIIGIYEYLKKKFIRFKAN
jgi:lycopene cyclase domain-containing protein